MKRPGSVNPRSINTSHPPVRPDEFSKMTDRGGAISEYNNRAYFFVQGLNTCSRGLKVKIEFQFAIRDCLVCRKFSPKCRINILPLDRAIVFIYLESPHTGDSFGKTGSQAQISKQGKRPSG